ncbi:transcription termination/antitermination factor NusG [Candidatus Marinamargulisbacteria bacterium SCGC AG-333-B06]|nr:transcription termination/antitermination factor NusG [Candidatus Marinamargulisbacteria bacterium SCGC AG-333-B06]
MSNTNTDITNSNENLENIESAISDDDQTSQEATVDQVDSKKEVNKSANHENNHDPIFDEKQDKKEDESEPAERVADNQLNERNSENTTKADSSSHLNWYIVQTLSNYELRVQTRVQQIIDEDKYPGKLLRVLVPTQQTVELKNNKRIEKVTKIFPGYIFIQMNIEDELAYELRQIPGIAKFVGIGNKPSPVVEDEILKVLRKVGDTSKEIDVDFEVDEVIKVVDGPFRGYTGSISEINSLKGNIKAKISIFGRETPVELDFEQVEKTV